jgi:cell division protein FtsA
MSNFKIPNIVAGLDIGSSKVTFIIGSINEESKIEVIGIGTAVNSGIRQGSVVNIEATTEAIKKAREEAELMSGYRIEEVMVAVSGAHIKSFDSKGMVAIKTKEVTKLDIDRVIEAAKAVAVPTDRVVLHVIPREYKVDSQERILDPVGMSGVRLEASVHIVTGNQIAINNNLKCIEKAGLKVVGMVLDQLASAFAVLSEDEKNLGVCVVDIGAGSCHLVYFQNGSVAHTSAIPVGGQYFTHDIAIGLRTPQLAAEELKKRYGCAMASLMDSAEMIEVEGVGGRKPRSILRKDLADVIEPRAEETLQLIYQDMQTSGLVSTLGSGVVLTGGASQLHGFVEMSEFVFDVPVRLGIPQGVGGLNDVVKSAACATSVGLLQFARNQKKFVKAVSLKSENKNPLSDKLGVEKISHKVRNFFDNLFE